MKICSVEDCTRKFYAKNLCSMHYQRLKIYGDTHYQRTESVCSVDGCIKKYKSHGYCNSHLFAHERYGDPLYVRERYTQCKVDGCLNKHCALGFCTKHYTRFKKHADISRNDAYTYGLWEHPLYHTWWNMLQRCNNPNSISYKNYGGRGIKVCLGWITSEGIVNFIEDMGEKPFEDYTLDRIDNDGDYSCGHCEDCVKNGCKMNCKWSSREDQSLNKRTSKYITYRGIEMQISELSKIVGVDKTILSNRIYGLGWSVDKAISVPVIKGKGNFRKKEYRENS